MRSTDDVSKQKRHNSDVNDIYGTFTDKEKWFVEGEPGSMDFPELYYEDKYVYDYPSRIYADIVKIKDIPVGYIEYWDEHDGGINVSIGVRNEEQYRNIGLASRMAKRGESAIQKMKQEGLLDQNIDTLRWYASTENSKSINAAIKNGFSDIGDSDEFTTRLEKRI